MKVLKLNPVVRAIGVLSAVAVLVGGVTFAALSSDVTLTNNTISGADANLQIWDGGAWATTAEGFQVNDVIPGEWSPENFFYFNNAGDTNLDITAKINGTPVAPEGGYGFSGWENLKVRFTSHAPDCEDNTVETDMSALMSGAVELPCNALDKDAAGNKGVEETEGNYSLSYKVVPESLTGTDLNIGEFAYTFTGNVAATPAPTPEPETP